jgi:hypothetical protein
MKIP